MEGGREGGEPVRERGENLAGGHALRRNRKRNERAPSPAVQCAPVPWAVGTEGTVALTGWDLVRIVCLHRVERSVKQDCRACQVAQHLTACPPARLPARLPACLPARFDCPLNIGFGRYMPEMQPEVKKEDFKKGSQVGAHSCRNSPMDERRMAGWLAGCAVRHCRRADT